MDPRLCWYQPELMDKAYYLWSQIWEISQTDPSKKCLQQSQQFEDEYLNYNESYKKPDSVKRSKASTYGFKPMLNNDKLTTPWLNVNYNLITNDFVRLIDHDNEESFKYEINPARYLLTLEGHNSDIPIIELDKGLLRYNLFRFI